MKLLKTVFFSLCIVGMASSCASYRSCPAYAQKSQQEIYNPDFQQSTDRETKIKSL